MKPRKDAVPDDVRDDQVEDALLRRAVGYEDESGKSVPPDVRAAMYWLENRRPDRWKRRRIPAEKEPEIGFSETEKEL
ncbi:MAG: hypothetical protein MR051_00460 [Lentisphaeria bacterium]|nr:hypothetical protein [Lentisphaeria bacterium]